MITRLVLLVLAALCAPIHGIYEDQIGKWDWHQKYIGKVQSAHFPSFTNELLLATTSENVVAGLVAKTGDILWRQILEKDSRGTIQFSTTFTETSANSPQPTFLTINGVGNPSLVRGWDPMTGNLLWEWSLTLANPERIEAEYWFYDNLMLYHVLAYWGSHLEVTQYMASSGQQLKSGTSRITTPWIVKDACVMAKPFFVCGVKSQVLAVNLVSDNGELFSKPLMDDITEPIQAVKGAEAAIYVNGGIMSLRGETIASKPLVNSKTFVETVNDERILLQVTSTEKEFKLSATNFESGEEISELSATIKLDSVLGAAQITAVKCRKKMEAVCIILLDTVDDSLVLVHKGQMKWTREESLANLVTMEMVELPLSYLEGTIEDEFNSKDGNILDGLIRRTSSQFLQLKSVFLTILGVTDPSAEKTASKSADGKAKNQLIRDAFGLHKIIVAVTKSGNIFGIDNMSGKFIWKRHLTELNFFDVPSNAEKVKLIALRTARHFPHPIQYALIGKERQTGYGFIYQFNPINGVEVSREILNYRIKQMMILTESEASTFIRPLLILDDQNNAHVLPKAFSDSATGIYMFTATERGVLNGYYVQEKLNVIPVWEVDLGGADQSQRVINVAGKSPHEHVHSQGRVLSDRSVLYKYINPNLVAVSTLGLHSIHKSVLNVYLIDVVSGAVVFSMTHKRAQLPFHMVHSENWIAYTYYNEKVRRTEITTMELYEGKTQANSTAWSSLDPPPLPMVERQSYIIPGTVVALKETITEKGITNKDILIGLSSGLIVEMPWALLDPRRPIQGPNQPREEGVIPYVPEVPIPMENIINYNQTVSRVQGIYTTPSGLESTCLVAVYGLDWFVTRVSPSKTFDLLKDDFDYILITVVLVALTAASYVTKHLASRKAQKMAWK